MLSEKWYAQAGMLKGKMVCSGWYAQGEMVCSGWYTHSWYAQAELPNMLAIACAWVATLFAG